MGPIRPIPGKSLQTVSLQWLTTLGSQNLRPFFREYAIDPVFPVSASGDKRRREPDERLAPGRAGRADRSRLGAWWPGRPTWRDRGPAGKSVCLSGPTSFRRAGFSSPLRIFRRRAKAHPESSTGGRKLTLIFGKRKPNR